MAVIVAVLGVLIVCGSVVALFAHGFFTRMAGFWLEGNRLYGAAVVRLVLGTLLLIAAPDTRMPAAVQALGVLTLATAVAVPLVGLERLRAFVRWTLERPPLVQRLGSLLGAALGAFLIYVGT